MCVVAFLKDQVYLSYLLDITDCDDVRKFQPEWTFSPRWLWTLEIQHIWVCIDNYLLLWQPFLFLFFYSFLFLYG